MLQEYHRPQCLGAFGRGTVWNTVHCEDVTVSCSHGVGLRRVSVLCDQFRLQQYVYKQFKINSVIILFNHRYINTEKECVL